MDKQLTTVPHLSFSGSCEEAIHTWIAAFGGEVLYLSRWSADSRDVTPEQVGKVMHAEFTLGSTRFAASDDPAAAASSLKLMLRMPDMASARQATAVLAGVALFYRPCSPIQPRMMVAAALSPATASASPGSSPVPTRKSTDRRHAP